MASASETMGGSANDAMLEIPIVACGRVIMPSEGDSVEFKGRGGSAFRGADPMAIDHDMHHMPPGAPHDGIEPMRRSLRWVIDLGPPPKDMPLSLAA